MNRDPLDTVVGELMTQWENDNRAFVIRKLVSMESNAQAALCAAHLALSIAYPLKLLVELRRVVPRGAPLREREVPAPRIEKPDRQFSLSDLPDAPDIGAVIQSLEFDLDDD